MAHPQIYHESKPGIQKPGGPRQHLPPRTQFVCRRQSSLPTTLHGLPVQILASVSFHSPLWLFCTRCFTPRFPQWAGHRSPAKRPGAESPPPPCMASRALTPSPEWPVGLRVLRGPSPTPNSGRISPRALGLRKSGEVRPHAAAEAHPGDSAPLHRAQTIQSRPILVGRPRLEPNPNRSRPPYRDPAAENHAYRFGL